jgi:uncharacterized protein
MQEQDIKDYLKNNPEFFEKNATLLADIHLPSPHGGGTISLAERQQLAQRDKINALEDRFAELVLNAEENDGIAGKIHAFDLKLHQAKSFNDIEQLISDYLPEHFDLNDTCLRVWAAPADAENKTNLVFSEISDDAKTWMTDLKAPFCGRPPSIAEDDWFIDPASSVAIIPLSLLKTAERAKMIGFLALASDDTNRFFARMGTDFLNKIGELIAAALSRHLAKE